MLPAMLRRSALLSLALAPLALATAVACDHHDLRSLTVDEVAARVALHDGKTFIYDDNPQDRYAKGHVPGAKWLEHSPTAADLPSDRSATLVFYCASEL